MEPNNNTNDQQDLLKDITKISKETLDKSADLKVAQITKEAIEIVQEYTKSTSDTLGELEIMLVRQISLFSVKEINGNLPKSLSDIPGDETQKAFMENIIYFWNQVIEKLKVWKP